MKLHAARTVLAMKLNIFRTEVEPVASPSPQTAYDIVKNRLGARKVRGTGSYRVDENRVDPRAGAWISSLMDLRGPVDAATREALFEAADAIASQTSLDTQLRRATNQGVVGQDVADQARAEIERLHAVWSSAASRAETAYRAEQERVVKPTVEREIKQRISHSRQAHRTHGD